MSFSSPPGTSPRLIARQKRAASTLRAAAGVGAALGSLLGGTVAAQADDPKPAPTPAPLPSPVAAAPAAPATAPAAVQDSQKPQMGAGDTANAENQKMTVSLPFTFKADLTFRYDDITHTTLQTGLVPTDQEGSLRARWRFFFVSPVVKQTDAVIGLSSGTNQTPTSPFLTFGDGFRGKPLEIARAYVTYYFNKTVTPNTPALLFGKMDNPFWRSQIGLNLPPSGIPNYALTNFSSEIVWDNDVTPEGIAVRLPLFKHNESRVKVTNTTAFYQINIPARQEFIGLTSDIYMVESQFHLDANWLQAGLSYYDYENLNSGLFAPIFQPGFGVDQATGTSAFLLRSGSGFQITNAPYAYSASVFGFGRNRFQIINPTLQIVPNYRLGRTHLQPFFVGEYLHNTSVDYLSTGKSYTLGLNRGTNHRDDAALWVTYRDVDADATLGTFADGDIGGGTDYKGWQVGGIYHLQDNSAFRLSYNDWEGVPFKTNHIKRLLVDFVKTF